MCVAEDESSPATRSWRVFCEVREGGRTSISLKAADAQCVTCRRNRSFFQEDEDTFFSQRVSVQAAGSWRAVSGSELCA